MLYTLSTEPDKLPDSLKGPIFMGIFRGDSLILRAPSERARIKVLHKCPSEKLSVAEQRRLRRMANERPMEVDVNSLTGAKGSDVKRIVQRARGRVSPGDPPFSPDGIYVIAGIHFMLIPQANVKLFRVLSVGKDTVEVESVCGKRRTIVVRKRA